MITVLERTAEELKMLNVRRQAVKGIQVRMRMLETDAAGIGGFDLTRPRVNGKQKKTSGRLGTVEEKERLQQQERALQGWIEHMEQALSALHPDDEKILRAFYCENKRSGEASRMLMDELHVSLAEIYRMRERALADLAARLGYIA